MGRPSAKPSVRNSVISMANRCIVSALALYCYAWRTGVLHQAPVAVPRRHPGNVSDTLAVRGPGAPGYGGFEDMSTSTDVPVLMIRSAEPDRVPAGPSER